MKPDNTSAIYLKLSLASYLVLILTISWWFIIALDEIKSPWIMGTLLALITLSPVPGILRQRPYTFAWAAMLVLAYFTHSLIELWANEARFTLALIELIASSVFICCAGMYARTRSRELRQVSS